MTRAMDRIIMHSGLRRFLLGQIGLFLGLASCTDPTGPVFGDWYGYQPLPVPEAQISVELVLDGPLTADHGGFRMHTQTMWTNGSPLNESDFLTGTWEIHPVTIQGQPCHRLILHGLDTGMHHATLVTDYIELPNGVLVPTAANGQPDLSPGGLTYRLAPRKRDSFGYGRA
ncbi:hypothetical protein AA101099_0032 [Neoasaia chiangmaiensis NBRC 101099]|nr:hypothetical protein [Neoasaia chiangmaiensis]GBR35442.1 hypothetical protein AA101099_0032 [Neoasaia chiangmaiensis NBRC 101099]